MQGKIWFLALTLLVFLGCTQSKSAEKEAIKIPEITSGDIDLIEQEINESEILADEIDTENATEIDAEINTTLNESEIEETNESNKSKEITGLFFGNGRYVLILDDIVLDETKPDGACAAIRIVQLVGDSAKGLGKEKVCKDADVNWVSPEGRIFRIRLIKIVPGYSQQSKWAEFRIFG